MENSDYDRAQSWRQRGSQMIEGLSHITFIAGCHALWTGAIRRSSRPKFVRLIDQNFSVFAENDHIDLNGSTLLKNYGLPPN